MSSTAAPQIAIRRTHLDHEKELVSVDLVLIANDAGAELSVFIPEKRLYEIAKGKEYGNQHIADAVTEIFSQAAETVAFLKAG